MATNVSDKKLKALIKESVKEVLQAELMKLRAFALPDVSPDEQKDVETRYGKPTKKHGKSHTLNV